MYGLGIVTLCGILCEKWCLQAANQTHHKDKRIETMEKCRPSSANQTISIVSMMILNGDYFI